MAKNNDFNKNFNNGILSNHGKEYSKTKIKHNKYHSRDRNNNLDSDYFKSNGGFSNNGIEAFTNPSNGQSQFLQSPEMQSGMNLGQPMPNPYPSNPANSRTISVQEINSQIQQLNKPNANANANANNLTNYSQQSNAVLGQNQLHDKEINDLMNSTSEYYNLLDQYDYIQNNLLKTADNQVLSMNKSTNQYLNSYIQIDNENTDRGIYYITNAGIAQPYSLSNPVNTMPIKMQNLPNVKADRDYVYTNPVMQIGNNKLQTYSSGYEGRNVYANNFHSLSITDSSFVGCLNTNPTIQPTIMTSAPNAPNSSGDNYTFQTCQTAAYDTGSQLFSFNLTNPTANTGVCYLTNDASAVIQQGPSVNYTYTKLWSTNIQNVTGSDMSGNYMGINTSGNIVIYNSSNSEIWSSDASGSNTLSATNYIGCYQSSITTTTEQPYNVQVPNHVVHFGPYTFDIGGFHNVTRYNKVTNTTQLMNNVTNDTNNTWETCYQYAYNNQIPYFGVSGFNPINGTTTCLVGTDLSGTIASGGGGNCRLMDDLNYGVLNSNAVYSATNAPTNAFLTLNDNGQVMAFIGLNLDDIQSVTWQLDMSGQTQMLNYDVLTNCTYMGSMQTGQTLQEGQFICSPTALLWFTMENGNLVLYTSSNTPKCYLMNSNGNEYYAGDSSMNALYQMNAIGDQSVLGNIGYVDENSILYPYPENMVGQDTRFTYMGNYDTSGTIIQYYDSSTGTTSDYYTGLDLSGSIQQCIDLSCNAFVMTTLNGPTNTQINATKFMSNAFATPFTYGSYPRYPNTNSQLYIRHPTVSNSQYTNKNIFNINSGLYNNYQTNNTPMNYNIKSVQLTTTNIELDNLSNQINSKMSQITRQINNLQNKTLTVNQQQQLNAIVLNTQFKKIDEVQNSEKQYQQSVVNANNIKNDSDLVVLKENQNFILWSVLAISIALITIHVIR